jgi:cytoskeletal protein CcmA (bactofilin family)
MFKNEKDAPVQESETVIAPSVRVEGDFVSEGNVRIEGWVNGSISTERDLFVGEQAKITANVVARNAVLSGELHGNLRVIDRLELTATAKIHGDIQTKVLTVAPGAIMKGQLVVGMDVPAVPAKAEEATETKSALARGRSAREKKIEEILQQ